MKRKVSFKNMLNSNEAKIESCGTSAKYSVQSLNDPFTLVLCTECVLCIDNSALISKNL